MLRSLRWHKHALELHLHHIARIFRVLSHAEGAYVHFLLTNDDVPEEGSVVLMFNCCRLQTEAPSGKHRYKSTYKDTPQCWLFLLYAEITSGVKSYRHVLPKRY